MTLSKADRTRRMIYHFILEWWYRCDAVPPLTTIAAALGLSRQTVQDHLNMLHQQKHICIYPYNRRQRYALVGIHIEVEEWQHATRVKPKERYLWLIGVTGKHTVTVRRLTK